MTTLKEALEDVQLLPLKKRQLTGRTHACRYCESPDESSDGRRPHCLQKEVVVDGAHHSVARNICGSDSCHKQAELEINTDLARHLCALERIPREGHQPHQKKTAAA